MDLTGPLLIATTNPDKLVEIRLILGSIELVTLSSFPGTTEYEETGETFLENARGKAFHYARATGALTAAEDSGFEVDALGGEPGVHSARYNGATYPEKFDAIYARLLEESSRA